MAKKYKDIIGKRFGSAIVIAYSNKKDKHGATFFTIKCDCGKVVDKRGSDITSPKFKGCGCLLRPDLLGKTFGQLIVTSEDPIRRKGGARMYFCRCTCGNITRSGASELTKGKSTKCAECALRVMHAKNTKPYGISAFTTVINSYKIQAASRNLVFLLTDEQSLNLFKENCFYCGISPSNISKPKGCNGEFIYNGIDRIDPKCGYEMWNCVSSCAKCNLAKLDYSIEEFDTWFKNLCSNLYNIKALI